jgi:HPt (histidine-containing phosphotransfer) domain-containing protein
VTEGGSEPIDGATFANLIEMTGGDLAFVDELVDTYVEEGRSLVERLRAAIADGSSEELLRAAHSLKSSSLNVGALTLGEQCRLVEAEARAGSPADQGGAVEAIAAAFEEARAALLAQRESRTSP